MSQLKIIKLKSPKLLEENILKKITCIRPHRERIFKVAQEKVNNKLIYHNYGQGGAGLTFLFGCVNESIRQFERQIQNQPVLKNEKICVIGAGCYGLLTAIMLSLRGFDVKIIAKETCKIASYNAAGFFFPRHRKSSTPQEIKIFRDFGIESYKIYMQIFNGQHEFIKNCVKLIPAYYAPEIDPGFKPFIDIGLIKQPQHVTITFNNQNFYDATEYKVLFIDSTKLMEELNSNIKKYNISVEHQEVRNFDQISEKIIFNCAGLGAKELAQDTKIVPVQGHLITLTNQPDIDSAQYLINFRVTMVNPNGSARDELIYYAPKGLGILGITFKRGVDSLTQNGYEFDRILKRSRDFFGL